MSSDPRVTKSRQPKAYTDEQLAFLRSYLPEYEKRSQGSIRGDSKKFAFQKAAEYIQTFGLSAEFIGVEDGETRFKEQIYNWFKNTVGRNRRKAEGRTRPSTSKKANALNGSPEKGTPIANGSNLSPTAGMSWNPTTSLTPYPGHHVEQGHNASDSAKMPGSSSLGQAMSPMYSPVQALGSSISPTHGTSPNAHSHSQHNHTHTSHSTHSLAQANSALRPTPNVGIVTQSTLREAFLNLDTSNLATLIQNFVATQPHTPTPLTTVVEALFEATIAEAPAYNRDPTQLVRRYFEAAGYLGNAVVHAGVGGSAAAARALQMAIRRNSVWVGMEKIVLATSAPNVANNGLTPGYGSSAAGQGYYHGGTTPLTPNGSATPGLGSSLTSSLTEDMQKIANERQRRKDHIQWARIHAAALELGMMSQSLASGRGGSSSSSLTPDGHPAADGSQHGNGYATSRAFSEMVARDSVWEADEAEWVAGMFVLKALIRTGVRGDRRQREEYPDMLRGYESRWKEIKDEVRQTMVMEALIAAKEDLVRLEDNSLA